MDANKTFVQSLNQYYDGDLECKSIIIPNSFGIRKVDCDTLIGKIDNKEIRITEKICMDYSLIGNYIWNCFSTKRKYLNYALIGYIANAIRFNSNIIRINIDILRGVVGSELSTRDYLNTISSFKKYSIIKDLNVRGMYEINPLAVFKGSIFKLINIAEEYGIKGYFDNGDKVILDKYAVIKDKAGKDVRVILNKKYYKDDYVDKHKFIENNNDSNYKEDENENEDTEENNNYNNKNKINKVSNKSKNINKRTIKWRVKYKD